MRAAWSFPGSSASACSAKTTASSGSCRAYGDLGEADEGTGGRPLVRGRHPFLRRRVEEAAPEVDACERVAPLVRRHRDRADNCDELLERDERLHAEQRLERGQRRRQRRCGRGHGRGSCEPVGPRGVQRDVGCARARSRLGESCAERRLVGRSRARKEDLAGGCGRERRVGRDERGRSRRIVPVGVGEMRLGEADACGVVSGLPLERFAEQHDCVVGAAGLEARGAGEERRARPFQRKQLAQLRERRAAAREQGCSREDRRDVRRMLGERAEVERFRLVAASAGLRELGEQAECEERAGSFDRRVPRGRVTERKAVLREAFRFGEVAVGACAVRELEMKIGVVGHRRDADGERRARIGDAPRGSPSHRDAAGEDRRVAGGRPIAVGRVQRIPRAVEMLRGLRRIAEHHVLAAEVELGEWRRRLARFLEQQFDVAPRLLLRADAALEIAVVADADRRRLEALRQERRHAPRLLLVDASLEAVLGPVAEDAEREVRDRRARFVRAGVVRLDEMEALAPRAAEKIANLARVARDEMLVGVEVEEPVARCRFEADVARVREGAVPREVDDFRAEAFRDLDGAVGRARIHDDDLVDRVCDGFEAAGKHLLFVLDDHAERDAEAACGPCRMRDAPRAHAERARCLRCRTEGNEAAAVLLALANRAEVLGNVCKRRIELARCGEERLGAAELAELVQEDTRVVQEHRLRRLCGQRFEECDGRCGEDRAPLRNLERDALGKHGLCYAAPRLVCALRVAELADRAVESGQCVGVADADDACGRCSESRDDRLPFARRARELVVRRRLEGRDAEGHTSACRRRLHARVECSSPNAPGRFQRA